MIARQERFCFPAKDTFVCLILQQNRYLLFVRRARREDVRIVKSHNCELNSDVTETSRTGCGVICVGRVGCVCTYELNNNLGIILPGYP